MESININSLVKKVPANIADVITPVSVYLKLRDLYPNTILLESSDYHGNNNSQSFICFEPIAEFKVTKGVIETTFPNGEYLKGKKPDKVDVPAQLDSFLKLFHVHSSHTSLNVDGLFGYSSYDAVQHFESIRFNILFICNV